MKSVNHHRALLLNLIVLVSLLPAAQAAEYTYPQLVQKAYDLKALAVLPEPGEQSLQWTSYDRRSYYDSGTDTYVRWDANGDGDYYIRRENGRIVMAEMDGPGCIWRIWAATAEQGNVTIYLDGKPAVDLPFENYFDGTVPPFNRDALVHIVANGKNNYTPMPFQHSCKIVADRDYGRYFIFGYSKFPRGTIVPTFSMDLSAADNTALDTANEMLKETQLLDYPNVKQVCRTITLSPDDTAVIFDKSGPKAITRFVCRLQNLPADIEQQRALLRSVALAMYWDGNEDPAVWSPLGDFFGTGPGVNEYASYPMGMSAEQFYSNWYMPFAANGKITLHNESDQPLVFDVTIEYAPIEDDICLYGRFHAKWHRDVLPLQDERGEIDWTLLDVQGAGRYVGTQLQIWNPRGGWWGEGDEKFYIDGEKFPSWFGTGSEDYIGYAWSSYDLFQHPYHNQTISEAGMGHISVNRWHIQDNIPFQRSFFGTIEKYFPDMRPTQFATVVYWYAAPDGADPFGPVALDDRLHYYKDVMYPLMCNGLIVLEEPAGSIVEQGMGGFPGHTWTDDKQLWWEAITPDHVLRLGFFVPHDGEYTLYTRLTKALDYGMVQLYLNDKPLGGAHDCYQAQGVGLTDEINLGTREMRQGINVLKVHMIGKNPQAYGRYMFGMDYLKVLPVE